MADYLAKIKGAAGVLGKGLMKELLPGIASGVFLELWCSWNEDISKLRGHVENDTSLWGKMRDKDRNTLRQLSHFSGGLNWLGAEWVIHVLRQTDSKEKPEEVKKRLGCVSYLVNSSEAYAWLEKQVEELKTNSAFIHGVKPKGIYETNSDG